MYSTPLGAAKPLINFPAVFPNSRIRKNLNFRVETTKRLQFNSYPRVLLVKASSNAKPSVSSGGGDEDFVSRVLRENPSQVEPKYLIGDKLYTLKEKEDLSKKGFSERVSEILKRLNLKALVSKSDEVTGNASNFVKPEGEVYLKDLLREYRGKLYVPEQVFGANLSEEEEFDKMAMRLDVEQVKDLLEAYMGPRNEIEKQMMSWVGKLPEYPHPVASKISSRMIAELGVLTASMAAAAVFVGGFLASAVFAVTSFVYAVAAYVIWPVVKPFLKLILGLIFGALERIWENLADFLGDEGLRSKLYEVYAFGGFSASIEMLKPILLVFLTMVLLVRFTLSRRPKNFRKWDIWQGIEFSQSKPQARVDGSTGVMFSDVAGIEEAVEELQETLSQVVFHRLDDESYMFERRPQLLHRLQVLLGGRAAEEVIFGRDTSKASVSYLADASWLARKIITIWNMEDPMVVHGEPPPWRKRIKFVGPRIDFEGSLYDDYDLIEPPINFKLDDDVARRTEELMRDMYGKTVALLRQHNAALLKTVKVLLDRKEINGYEIDFILDNYPPETPTSLVLEERNPGSLPLFEDEQSQSNELEYTLLTS
ncbi:putative inactive ATP-dependent zinc metalloprotease FTSHI 1, chloroplastic [Sesamum angolense]|uniref:Inactive ATP-dependent zinc metalloprotease FTSHI 1, chloroplastic n=1 Tax=Sesamum angolense TaxID=2727404 RepID=A0AAE1W085_9LAMI|nr:putative inactive ATP-dependent zinc metalloprotease FTSHI 1, chloroplastic [Sesamum angolense]